MSSLSFIHTHTRHWFPPLGRFAKKLCCCDRAVLFTSRFVYFSTPSIQRRFLFPNSSSYCCRAWVGGQDHWHDWSHWITRIAMTSTFRLRSVPLSKQTWMRANKAFPPSYNGATAHKLTRSSSRALGPNFINSVLCYLSKRTPES